MECGKWPEGAEGGSGGGAAEGAGGGGQGGLAAGPGGGGSSSDRGIGTGLMFRVEGRSVREIGLVVRTTDPRAAIAEALITTATCFLIYHLSVFVDYVPSFVHAISQFF